jgi:hypothetical protein
MVHEADLKIGTVIKIDGSSVEVKAIGRDYVIVKDQKGNNKMYGFKKIESLFNV